MGSKTRTHTHKTISRQASTGRLLAASSYDTPSGKSRGSTSTESKARHDDFPLLSRASSERIMKFTASSPHYSRGSSSRFIKSNHSNSTWSQSVNEEIDDDDDEHQEHQEHKGFHNQDEDEWLEQAHPFQTKRSVSMSDIQYRRASIGCTSTGRKETVRQSSTRSLTRKGRRRASMSTSMARTVAARQQQRRIDSNDRTDDSDPTLAGASSQLDSTNHNENGPVDDSERDDSGARPSLRSSRKDSGRKSSLVKHKSREVEKGEKHGRQEGSKCFSNPAEIPGWETFSMTKSLMENAERNATTAPATTTTKAATPSAIAGVYDGVVAIMCDLQIHAGEDLAPKDRRLFLGKNYSSDPYIEVWKNLPTEKLGRTPTVYKTLAPRYNNDSFYLQWSQKDLSRCFNDRLRAKIILKIWDEDQFSSPDAMGNVEIPLPLPGEPNKAIKQWFLVDKESAKGAKGRLQISFEVRYIKNSDKS